MKWLYPLLAVLALVATPSAAAILPGEQPAAAPSATAEATISVERQSEQDPLIARRIASIFAEVPSLVQVSARVDEGVVTLEGTVSDSEASARAEAIAGRVSGVVTVENRIERDVSVRAGDQIDDLGERVSGFSRMLPLIGVALLVALLIAGFGYLLASLSGLWNRLAPNTFLAELIASSIRFVFIVGGIVIGLDMIGAGALMGAVLGGAGVIGIALGFAMRDTIENYVASLMLSLRQPFRANDLVVIEQYEGRVIRLTSRATILMTLDGNHLRIPNSMVFRAVILNYTRNPERRFDFTIGIDADDNPTDARQLGVETLRALPFVLDKPEPQGWVEEVGDSNIVLRFLGWINQDQADFNKAKSRAIPAVKDALEQAGFAIPEPIYRLRLDSRSAPFPVPGWDQARTDGTSAPAAAPAARPKPAASAPPAEADVSPTDEIARMVDAERADRKPGENDLLDSSRPVE